MRYQLSRLSIDEYIWKYHGEFGKDYNATQYSQLQTLAEEANKEDLTKLINAGRSVVVDYSFCSRVDRETYASLVRSCGGVVQIIAFKLLQKSAGERLKISRLMKYFPDQNELQMRQRLKASSMRPYPMNL